MPTFIMICLTVFNANMNVCTGLDGNSNIYMYVCVYVLICQCEFITFGIPLLFLILYTNVIEGPQKQRQTDRSEREKERQRAKLKLGNERRH